ncbi:MAG TPA: TROVE domain-containing protein, partial [Candidatus Bathyarchaeota archaeon]|nr:TROVE domain-containing protein [Candidatus Bathyarchaeota archaeon]
MTRYGEIVNPRVIPQHEQAREDQVKNRAGGYVWQVDCWTSLDRFLILGAEGSTYYVGEKKLVKENAKAIGECLKQDGLRTVARVTEISQAGRAVKNDPAVFCLAMAAGHSDSEVRKAALQALPKVCRIGTDLF